MHLRLHILVTSMYKWDLGFGINSFLTIRLIEIIILSAKNFDQYLFFVNLLSNVRVLKTFLLKTFMKKIQGFFINYTRYYGNFRL